MAFVSVKGNLTNNPKVTQCSNGNELVQFGIAENQPNGEPQYHNIAIFTNKLGYYSAEVKKGDFVLIRGRINSRKYEKLVKVGAVTKKVPSVYTELLADRLHVIWRKPVEV